MRDCSTVILSSRLTRFDCTWMNESLWTGYLMVGLAVTGITYMHNFTGGLDIKKQRYIAYAIMMLGAWSFAKVVGVYRWKTGYRWRTYFF
jgi:hypothetical protein